MKRILIVDDNDQNIYLLNTILSNNGFEVISASNGEEALEIARKDPPDLIISDILMPRMDGFLLCRNWMSDSNLSSSPFVFYTATYTTVEDEELAKSLGATAYIRKPSEPDEFLRTIRSVVERHQAGNIKIPDVPELAKETFLREYNEVLIKKLQDKILEVATVNQQLQLSEEKYRNIVETALEGIWIIDENQKTTFVNNKMAEMLGYSVYEIIGKPLYAFMDEEGRAIADQNLEDRRKGIKEQHDFKFLRKDGKTLFALLSTKPIYDEDKNYIGALAMVTDIRKRVVAQKAQRKAEERYRKIFDGAVEGIYQSTPDGKLTVANQAMANILGYESPRELIDSISSIDEQIYVDPKSRQHYKKILERDGFVQGFEVELVRKDGGVIWVSDHTRIVKNAKGKTIYYEGIMEDLTEKKKLQEHLMHSQKMEAIGTLAGGVAHDFNNLLTVILGYSDLILRQPDQPESIREKVQTIRATAEHAATITSQLLLFSRPQLIKPKIIDVNAVVKDVEKMLARLIGEDIEVIIRLDDDSVEIRADAAQMGQVLVNLAVNARAAMPNGGKLTIETKRVELTEDYVKQHDIGINGGSYVILSVSDDGIGMDVETKLRIFEPFFSTKPKGQGTGLGLSTVYGVINQWGGSLWVHSELGIGTTFNIYLPEVARSPDEIEESHPAIQLSVGNETILIVEDDEQLRSLTKELLTEVGYEVIVAVNGAEALPIYQERSEQIDMVMTDVVMPQMGGRELADRLRTNYPNVKILFVSGYTNEAVVHHDVDDVFFLQKPYTAIGLTRKVKQVLEYSDES